MAKQVLWTLMIKWELNKKLITLCYDSPFPNISCVSVVAFSNIQMHQSPRRIYLPNKEILFILLLGLLLVDLPFVATLYSSFTSSSWLWCKKCSWSSNRSQLINNVHNGDTFAGFRICAHSSLNHLWEAGLKAYLNVPLFEVQYYVGSNVLECIPLFSRHPRLVTWPFIIIDLILHTKKWEKTSYWYWPPNNCQPSVSAQKKVLFFFPVSPVLILWPLTVTFNLSVLPFFHQHQYYFPFSQSHILNKVLRA